MFRKQTLLACTSILPAFLAFSGAAHAQEISTPKYEVRKFPVGVAIQVHMVDGRTLEGKLISSSAASFELRESGQESVETIECADVTAVSQIDASPRKKRTWVVTAIVVGALAATGVAASRAGGLY